MDELTERLGRLAASAVHDVLRGLGHDDCTLLPDIRPLSAGSRLAGRVVTISGRERAGLGTDETLLAWATLLSEIPPGGIVEESGLTVFCSHVTPADIAGRWLPDPVGGPITIGRCAIATGDYLIADRDGVVILPQALAARAVAEAVMGTESRMRQAILAGVDPREAYLEFGKF